MSVNFFIFYILNFKRAEKEKETPISFKFTKPSSSIIYIAVFLPKVVALGWSPIFSSRAIAF